MSRLTKSAVVLTIYADGTYEIDEKAVSFKDLPDWSDRRLAVNRAAVAAFRQLQSATQVMNANDQRLYKLDEFGNLTSTKLHQAQSHGVIENGERIELTPVALEIIKMCNKPGRVPISYKEAAERANQTFRLTTLLARFRAWRNS